MRVDLNSTYRPTYKPFLCKIGVWTTFILVTAPAGPNTTPFKDAGFGCVAIRKDIGYDYIARPSSHTP